MEKEKRYIAFLFDWRNSLSIPILALLTVLLLLFLNMRNLIILWLGQTVSIIGSSMTDFAMTFWVWELTGQATALALFGFFMQVPRLLIAPFAGAIADRANRKLLMAIGDTAAGFLTIIILLLYTTNSLQIWHLYVAVAIKSSFEQIQEIAYTASISMMVPPRHYSRASSIAFLANYGSAIIVPALAGSLYYVIGIVGIMAIDIATFSIAIVILVLVPIPQPKQEKTKPESRPKFHRELSAGFRYIAARKNLQAMLLLTSLFGFAHDLGDSIYSPMILARTGNDARILGTVTSAAGVGGIIGATLLSTWGGPKRRIHGLLLGMMGAGASKMVFSLGQMLLVWVPAQFCSSFNIPLLGSCNEAIWLAKVQPEIQGRVFAARAAIRQMVSAIAYLIAGPLADSFFEPAMKSEGFLAGIFGGIFGTGSGAGMALLYAISSLGLLTIGSYGFAFPTLRDVDSIESDIN